MEQSPLWEATSRSAIQEFPNILWNPNVHCHVQWSLSWARWIHSIKPHLRCVLIFSHLCLRRPSGPFPLVFLTKTLYACPFYPIRATCRAQLILDLIIQIIFGCEWKVRSSSLCSFLQPPITSFLFSLNVLLSILFSSTLSLCTFLKVKRPSFTPIQNHRLLFFCCCSCCCCCC
jgi:hypothetical protein